MLRTDRRGAIGVPTIGFRGFARAQMKKSDILGLYGIIAFWGLYWGVPLLVDTTVFAITVLGRRVSSRS